MATTSPLPGAIIAPPRQPEQTAIQVARRRALSAVSPEESDVPATLAVAASSLAAAWCLGSLFSSNGLLGLLDYRLVRVLLYSAPFLFGTIVACGYTSRSRAARFLASVATVNLAVTAFAWRFDLAGPLTLVLKYASGVAFLAGATLWGLRALRRHLLKGSTTP